MAAFNLLPTAQDSIRLVTTTPTLAPYTEVLIGNLGPMRILFDAFTGDCVATLSTPELNTLISNGVTHTVSQGGSMVEVIEVTL
jgi:hypothetical protein